VRLLTSKRVDKGSFHPRKNEEGADGASGSVEDIRRYVRGPESGMMLRVLQWETLISEVDIAGANVVFWAHKKPGTFKYKGKWG
jgi:hypothetical protein